MASLTVNQTIDGIDSFIRNITALAKSYYVYIGRPDAWPDDNNPPTANGSVTQTELDLYRHMVYGKMITDSDVSFMIPKNTWVANTVYNQYSQDDADFTDTTFYVLTDLAEVYKCIYNNDGAPSTIKPSLTSTTGTFQTGDGYIWKYMFTVDSAANTKFSTTSHIPVTPNANVVAAAVPGTIDYINLTNQGIGYEVYEEGFLHSLVNNYVVELPSNSSPYNNYYTGSSIYLKSGGASGQIRTVAGYSGLSKQILVDSPFDVSTSLNLSNVSGTILTGETVRQVLVSMAYLYVDGLFNLGDTVVQSETGAAGVITRANTSILTISPTTNTDFTTVYPIRSTASAPVVKAGKVRVISGNNYVIANSGTAFVSSYSPGDYIRVGDTNTNNNVRRVMSVNSTVVVVDANTPFTANMVSNNHYAVPVAAQPTSSTRSTRTGVITATNLTGQRVQFGNTQPVGSHFIIGESIKQVDVNNVDQGANAVVAFANGSTLYLSSIQGVLTANLYLIGQSSNTKVNISVVESYPNITIADPIGNFEVGQDIQILNASNTITANANLISAVSNPNDLTEYVISPKVDIVGDGTGAKAYAHVDLSGANPSRQITNITMIDGGINYTQANVAISANVAYGSNAVAVAAISPLQGHGANAHVELVARYAGVSMTFANGENESYRYPVSGSYRQIGIIEGPLWADATLTLSEFDHVRLTISNKNGNNFEVGEAVIQPSTNATGIVVYSNSTFIELRDANKTFSANTANDNVLGLSSDAAANTRVANVAYFQLLSNVETISNITTGATAYVSQIISNTSIRVANVEGHLSTGDRIVDSATNAYATIMAISVANNTVDASANFAMKFNQTYRLTFASNTTPFQQFEVISQAGSNATGRVMTADNETDLVFTSSNGTFSTGQILTNQNTGATAIVVSANNDALLVRCTSANGAFVAGDIVTNNLGRGGALTAAYAALVVFDSSGRFQTGAQVVTGANSGATGLLSGVIYPDLVKNSGEVMYLENVSPFARSNTSVEKVNIIIKF